MVPVFAWALLRHDGDDNAWRWIAYGIFAVAMITDKIDGDLARKHNLITDFGKIADPIADKALTGMAFIGLSIIGELWWWVTIVVLVREWGITFMRFWLIKHGIVVPASQGGKVKTLVQTLALGILITPVKHLHHGWGAIGEILWWIGVIAMAIAVLITVVTGVQYVFAMLAARREAKAAHST
ncbi:MAG: CDP-diacylglycerol--glycerol-3-phosphate 3-phosphatidyltransferase [Nocardioidaceae bacterium]|nr:MAG: CDP-diacylglycerol--glycerol-3-phosphate 3-phosphatidyltransferase [Nocardioidaceae bacterium]